MLIAIISDIHGNIDALQAALKCIQDNGAEMTICLGDVVGYGPSPSECVKVMRTREIPCVMGNHDEYVSMIMDPAVDKLREEVRKSIEWTQAHLTLDDIKWLSELPMQMECEGYFQVLHSSYAPKKWAYCLDERTFANSFLYQPVQLAFCGHSHSPLIAYDQGPDKQPFVDFIHGKMTIPEDVKVMVNVGSVGQPRDRDPRACVVFYELETRQLWLERVPYNAKLVFAKVLETKGGLPIRFGERLLEGR